MVTDPRIRRETRIAASHVAASPPYTIRDSRTILMVDYYFPPISGAAVRRTTGYVKHLGDFGWSPIVLTVRGGDGYYYDSSLLEMIPDSVNVVRTASLEPLRFARKVAGRSADHSQNPNRQGRASVLPWMAPRWMRNAARATLLPYGQIGWFPFAVSRALQINRARGFDAIYSTSTSVTSHLIALTLRKILDKPWVADFQDPWVTTQFVARDAHRRIGEHIERCILQGADHITFASESVLASIQRTYGLPPGKLSTALLGFDPDVFDNISPTPRSKFTITHFGSFYTPRSPGSFLKALGHCVREHRAMALDTDVLFFGRFDAETLAETNTLLDHDGLRDIVRLEGIVPYTLGLQHLMGSHVLLLVNSPGEDEHEGLIPTKLFDYLGTGRPILALAPTGPVAQIVRDANAGVVVHPNDVRSIADSILSHYEKWKSGIPALPENFNRASLRKYSARELTRQFASILDDMSSRASS